MSQENKVYCKFCGEQIEFLIDFSDHYCHFCKSFQTTNNPPLNVEKGARDKHLILPEFDDTEPLKEPLILPENWKKNLPIFRHKQYLLKPVLSLRQKHIVYNINGQKIAECVSIPFALKANFDFLDLNGNVVGTIKAKRLKYMKSRYEVFNHENLFVGAIHYSSGLFKANYELFDQNNKSIGMPVKEKGLDYNYRIRDESLKPILVLDRKYWSGSMKVTIDSSIDPILGIAFGVIFAYIIDSARITAASSATASV
ncbi:MAG: hypothetical protein JXA54_14625 [Candidatus Heimdallarchaeota archaeon]|nr:hypothetical protein [Candidatus Heimdallarchaeota archaeon]